jgi:hypothetical protein
MGIFTFILLLKHIYCRLKIIGGICFSVSFAHSIAIDYFCTILLEKFSYGNSRFSNAQNG